MDKGGTSGERVLVISSSPLATEILKALERGEESYQVTVVDPREVDSAMAEEEFSAVVLDATGSPEDALEIAQKIRFLGGHIPTVAVGDPPFPGEDALEKVDVWVSSNRLGELSKTLKDALTGPKQSLKLSLFRALTAKLLAALPIAVFSLNSRGELWYANRYCREEFRIDFSAIGTPVWLVEPLCRLIPKGVLEELRRGALEEHRSKVRWVDPEGEERVFQLEVHPLDKGRSGQSHLFILSECTSEERERLRLLESRRLYASALELVKRMFSAPKVEVALESALGLIKSDFHCNALFFLEINGGKIVKFTEGIEVDEKNIPCLRCRTYTDGIILFGDNISPTCLLKPKGKGSWCFPIYLEKSRPQGVFRCEVEEGVKFANLVELSMMHLSSEIGLILQRFMLFSQVEMAKREWEETFDAIRNPIILVDEKRRISRANKAFAELLGGEVSDLIGQRCYQVLYESDNPPDSCPLQACVKGEDHVEREMYLSTVNREFVVSVYKARDDKGRPFFIHTMKDITELKKTQAQLFYTSKLASLGQMAAAIAHEINNPMAAISGFAEILLDEITDPTHQRYLNNIIQAAQRVGNTVKATLLLTEAPKDDATELVDLNQVINEALNVVTPLASKGGIVVNTTLTSGKVAIMGNRSLLLQAILAFLQNAIESIEEKENAVAKVVTVITDRGLAGESIVEISDTGTGIPKHVKPRIFDPFFSTKGYGKTGLGLSVAKSIIDRFGGRIEIDSDLGLGTTFRIIFPSTHFMRED